MEINYSIRKKMFLEYLIGLMSVFIQFGIFSMVFGPPPHLVRLNKLFGYNVKVNKWMCLADGGFKDLRPLDHTDMHGRGTLMWICNDRFKKQVLLWIIWVGGEL